MDKRHRNTCGHGAKEKGKKVLQETRSRAPKKKRASTHTRDAGSIPRWSRSQARRGKKKGSDHGSAASGLGAKGFQALAGGGGRVICNLILKGENYQEGARRT